MVGSRPGNVSLTNSVQKDVGPAGSRQAAAAQSQVVTGPWDVVSGSAREGAPQVKELRVMAELSDVVSGSVQEDAPQAERFRAMTASSDVVSGSV